MLIDNEIRLLVDVRSRPVSRFAPFSNRRSLPGLLESIGIDYVLMGSALGGRPEDPTMYDSQGKPDYDKMRMVAEFQDDVGELAELASQRRTVILCSEGDPRQCHRRLLLGPPLEDAGLNILHIMRDGNVSSELEIASDRRTRKLL